MVNRKWIYLLIFFIIVLVKFHYMDVNHSNYYWDEVVYLDLAKNINMGGYTSTIGEEFRAPLLPYLLSKVSYAHFLIFCLVIIGLILTFYLGKEIFNEETGLIAAIILGSMQLYFFYSFKILTEPLIIIFFVGAMYFIYKYLKEKKSYFLYLCAGLIGLSVLTKYLSGIMLIAIFLYLLFTKNLRKDSIIAGLIFLVVISPIFILGMINYGNPLGMVLSNLFDNTTASGGFFYYFINFFSILGFIVPVMFVYGLFSKENKKPMLYFLVIYFIVLMILSTKYERFFVIMFPFIAIIAAQGFYKLQKKYKIGMILLAIFVIINLSMGLVRLDLERSDTSFLINTAQELRLDGKVASNSPVYFRYFSNMDVVHIPEIPEEIDAFDYYIIDNYHPREDNGFLYYTNYLKEEGTLVYNFTESNREVLVYETET